MDEDGAADYVMYNSPVAGQNYYLVTILNAKTYALVGTWPLAIYTDFNAGFMEMYVPAAPLGINSTNPDFDFQVFGYDWDGNEDVTAGGSFNYVDWPLGWNYSGEPAPGAEVQDALVWINSVAGYQYSQPLGALIVDYNGNPDGGGQTYVQPFTVTLPEPGLIQTRATASLRLPVAYARPSLSSFWTWTGASGPPSFCQVPTRPAKRLLSCGRLMSRTGFAGCR